MDVIREGYQGEAVRDIQRRLTELGYRIDAAELEGMFGPETDAAVRAFQGNRSLPVDGIVGPDTWAQLVEAGYRLGDRTLYLRAPAFRGDDVRELQQKLNALGFDAGKEDGIFGSSTADAVMEFQRNVADRADGIVGLDTLRSLERMRPALDGPSRAVVREEEAVRSMRSSLAGSTIAIDAAYGPRDPGAAAPLAGHEAELTLRLAAELAAELRHRGAATLLLRDAARDETPSDRAQAANRAEATICVSLHLTDDVPDASGASCAYWGSATTHSPGGRRLAEVIQRELDRMGLPDGGIRPLTISLLRETRMPAVLVEPCHHVDADGQICLADPAFRRKVVRAIAEGIEGFFAAAV